MVGDASEILFVVIPKQKLGFGAGEFLGEIFISKATLSAEGIKTGFPNLDGMRFVLRREIVDLDTSFLVGIEPFANVFGVSAVAPRFEMTSETGHVRGFHAGWRRPWTSDDFKIWFF